MTWSEGRRLASLSGNGKSYTYSYDLNGIRTKKVSSDGSSRKYYIVDGKAVGETVYKANGGFAYNLRYTFDEKGDVCGVSYWGPGATAWTKYYFTKNLQGDVTGVYRVEAANDQIAGFTKVASYTYDSWGNVLSQSGEFAEINPFRYRSYYQDAETGFYYVSSRYYDPEVGRWINADSVLAGPGDNLLGFNMFAYCFNNPVDMADDSGHWPKWIKDAVNWGNNNIIQPVVGFAQGIAEDINNFDLKNESEEKTLESNYISAYKGVPVIRTNGDRSGSFGAIFLTRETNDRSNPEDVLRHEYGHTRQLKQLGVINFALCIGLPSWQQWGTGEYYSKPWEITADIYGGVQSRNHSQNNIDRGVAYLEGSKIIGPLIWAFIK